jgi:hypothetical protein
LVNIVDKGIKCDSTDTTVNTNNTLKKNMLLSRANTNSNWRSSSTRNSVKSGENSYRSFVKSSAQTRKLASRTTNSTASNTASSAAISNAKKQNNNTKKKDNSGVLDKTIYIPIPKEGSNGTVLSGELLNTLFKNPNIKVYSSLITSNGLIFAILMDNSDISNRKFYYILMEIDISELELNDKLTEIKQYYNNGKSDIRTFSYVNESILTVYLIKEFTPGDKVFTTLGNECIYKLFSNMHDFYTKDRIELPLSSDSRNSITTIPNFYRYLFFQLSK